MKHATRFAIFLLLVGCGQPQTSTKERAEVADVNARNALAKQRELQDQVDDLEERVTQLENR